MGDRFNSDRQRSDVPDHEDQEDVFQRLSRELNQPTDSHPKPGPRTDVSDFQGLEAAGLEPPAAVRTIYANPQWREALAHSPTLRQTIQDIVSSPRGRDLQIKLVSNVPNSFFSPAENTVYISAKAPLPIQLRDLAHEVFHATHQDDDHFYARPEPLDWPRFAARTSWLEARSFLQEVKVAQELGQTNPILFMVRNGNRIEAINISKIAAEEPSEQQQIAAIAATLANHLPAGGDSYPDVWRRKYNYYVQHFGEVQHSLIQRGYIPPPPRPEGPARPSLPPVTDPRAQDYRQWRLNQLQNMPPRRGGRGPDVTIYSRDLEPDEIHQRHARDPNAPDYGHRIYTRPENE